MSLSRCLAGVAVVPTDDPGVTARLRALLISYGLAPRLVGGAFLAEAPDGMDPVLPVLAALLGEHPLPVRFGIGVAADAPGAAARALEALASARTGRHCLAAASEPGAGVADIVDRAAVLDAVLRDTTPRQGEIARRLLIDGRRQAAIAAELGISRATVSVSVGRGRAAAIAAAHRLLRSALAPASGPLAIPAGREDAGLMPRIGIGSERASAELHGLP